MKRPSSRPAASLARSLSITALGLLALACAPGTAPSPRPNVLLISLDTLRADALGSYGAQRGASPFLDELSASGMRFANAFVNCHPTPPSHATILTSRYQETHQLFTGRHDVELIRTIPSEIPMLQETLRDAGYATVAVTGGGFTAGSIGFERGFDAFLQNEQLGALPRWLDARAGDDRPVFAFLHTYEIHAPYLPPPRYRALFGEHESPFHPTGPNLLRIRDDASQLDAAALAKIEAWYAAGVRWMDDRLRRLFAELDARGFLDDAVVVVTSDHGEEFGEHGGLLHGPRRLYDEILAVPLILWGTGVPPGRVVDRLVSSVDIAPTLLALAGVPRPAGMEGRDLLAPPAEGPDGRDEFVIAQFEDQDYAIRTPNWKLIVDVSSEGDGGVELYDLVTDPGEQRDVSGEQPERVAALRARLDAWRAERDRSVAPGRETRLPAATVEQLRELGYVEDDAVR